MRWLTFWRESINEWAQWVEIDLEGKFISSNLIVFMRYFFNEISGSRKGRTTTLVGKPTLATANEASLSHYYVSQK